MAPALPPHHLRAARDQAAQDAAENAPTATVHVAPDGGLSVLCSCRDLTEYDRHGPAARRALQRLTAHMQLHVSAAAAGLPWVEVRARRLQLEQRHQLDRDDDYGNSPDL